VHAEREQDLPGASEGPLSLDRFGMALDGGTLLDGVSFRLPPAGVVDLRGDPAALGWLARSLARHRIDDRVRTWGEVRSHGVDARIRPSPVLLDGHVAGSRDVLASLVSAFPARRLLAILELESPAARREAMEEACASILQDLDIDLDLQRDPASLPEPKRRALELGRAHAAGAPAVVVTGSVAGCERVVERLAATRPIVRLAPDDGPAAPTVVEVASQPGGPPPPVPTWLRWARWGRLGGMSRPGTMASAEEQASLLKRFGIRVVIGLEEEDHGDGLRREGIDYRHHPVVDMRAPTAAAARALARSANEVIRGGDGVVFHCKAGLGRTGTLIAATLIEDGYTDAEALFLLRQIHAHYVQSEEQTDLLRELAATRTPRRWEVGGLEDPVTEVSVDALDRYPFGVVRLDRSGRVLTYNLFEERLARVRREDVLGKSFFFEVAPCTRVRAFYGRFADGVARRELFATFGFVFRFPHGTCRVTVSMIYERRDDSVWVLIREASSAGPGGADEPA
jgi:photoactive yellow protein